LAGAFAAFKKTAYLLIEVDPGSESDIMRELSKMKTVVQADLVHGAYDIICVMKGKYDSIDESVVKIRKISHIRKTTTLTVFDTHLE
jgi:hypothetical protein